MVIDSPALIALLLGEPETADLIAAIAAASNRVVSAPTYLETAIAILARSGPKAQEKLDRLLNDLEIEVVSFARDQAALAATAYRQYGNGSGHAAGLNFGDCFSYALAKLRNEPCCSKATTFRIPISWLPLLDSTRSQLIRSLAG
jgi:ribonuclease VapC